MPTRLEHFEKEHFSRQIAAQGFEKETYSKISSQIGANQKWQKNIISNPFAPEKTEFIKKHLGPNHIREAQLAAARWESLSSYDNEPKFKSKEEKREYLFNELNSFAEAVVRLTEYIENNLTELSSLSDEVLFARLHSLAFNTYNSQIAHETFSRRHRRILKTVCVNIIHDRQVIHKYQKILAEDTRAKLGALVGVPITSEFRIEFLPMAICVYVTDLDWQNWSNSTLDRDGNTVLEFGAAVLKYASSLPEELQGKVIFINEGGHKMPKMRADLIEEFKKHEIRHVLYRQFRSQFEFTHFAYIEGYFKNAGTDLETHTVVADFFANALLEMAHEESLTYSVNKIITPSPSSVGENRWLTIFSKLSSFLETIPDVGQREAVKHIYYKAYESYVRNLKDYLLVSLVMQSSARKDHSKISLRKAEALLATASPDKVRRLSYFLGQSPQVFDEAYTSLIENFVSSFDDKVKEIVQRTKPEKKRFRFPSLRLSSSSNFGMGWATWAQELSFNEHSPIRTFFPVEALDSLLLILRECTFAPLVDETMDIIRCMVFSVDTLPSARLSEILKTLHDLGQKRTPNLVDVAKKAKELKRILENRQ